MFDKWLAAFLVITLVACGGDGGGETTQDAPEPDGGAAGAGGDPGGDGGGDGRGGAGGDAADAGPEAPITPQAVRFELSADPGETPLGAIPWPSDVYLTPGGDLDLRGFPRPRRIALLETVIASIEAETGGFGTTTTMYFGFGGPIDVRALPADGRASLAADSALALVDVDPDSPHRGERFALRWQTDEDGSAYLPPHTLMVRPVQGVVLRPATTYALIVTDAVGIAAEPFQATLAAARPADAALARAWEVHAPLRTWLAEESAPPAIAAAAVFTTQDPVGELFRVRDFIHELPPPSMVFIDSQGVLQDRFEVFDGAYRAPRFQEGEIPYRAPGTGAIRFADDGRPVVQGFEQLRFSLSVPLEDAPLDGWPIVMYAHGSTGDYESYIGEQIGSVAARNGVAVLSIDQIHHGTRNNGACETAADRGVCEELLFFNFLVPAAGRDNVRQAALDYVSLLRFAQTLEILPSQTVDGRIVSFNRDNIMFMGHSQGGLNGPLFLAIEKEVKGAMFSGAGGGIDLAIEQKKQPVDLNTPVRGVLGLAPDDPLDRWHPTLMLLETYIAPGDGVNYARYWFAEPREGYAPKSVFMTVGLKDEFTPPELTYTLAAAGHVPVIDPVAAPIEALELLGTEVQFPPYRANVAGGDASAGLAQYPNGTHFVIFQDPSARQRYGRFLQSLANEDPPQIF